MADIKDLQKQVIKFRDDRQWKKYHSPKDLGLGLICEAAEFAEHFKYWQGDKLDEYISKNKEGIGDEIIDILFWTLLAAHDLDIDIEGAFKRKLKKNAQKYPLDGEGLEQKLIKKFFGDENSS